MAFRRLADGSVNTFAHGSARQVFVAMIMARTSVVFFNTRGSWLKCRKIRGVGCHQGLSSIEDIRDQTIKKVQRH